MLAFLSYQTADKHIAASVAGLLKQLGYSAFMAHEHIEVSAEWRLQILEQLENADIFVPILSTNYYSSIWCKQESGIAAYRDITIIPLSTDGAIPQGFIGAFQSTKIDPNAPTLADLLPGVAKHNVSSLIDSLIVILAGSGNYRNAEANFERLLPYLPKATPQQNIKLLEESAKNNQICNAGLCAQKYLPPIFAAHGNGMNAFLKKELGDTLKRYENPPPR